MKKLGIITIALSTLMLTNVIFKTSETANFTTSLNGPSSVAALNTDFNSQEALDQVFENWLFNFKHEANECETILSNLEEVVYPKTYQANIISFELRVFNKCEKKLYTHSASFELVKLYDDNKA